VIEFLMALLVIGLLVSLIAAASFWAAWQRGRRANQVLARRLDAEGQIEAATMFTLAAMREAARDLMRRPTQ
jgi:Tfp pilus assembly protein PilW